MRVWRWQELGRDDVVNLVVTMIRLFQEHVTEMKDITAGVLVMQGDGGTGHGSFGGRRGDHWGSSGWGYGVQGNWDQEYGTNDCQLFDRWFSAQNCGKIFF